MRPHHLRAFALADSLATIVALGFALTVLLIATADTRRLAKMGEDLSHLREIGSGTGQYAADFGDQFWSLSWQPDDVQTTPWFGLNGPHTNAQRAGLAQVTYLIRVLGNRTDQQMPSLTSVGIVPHPTYSHLVLLQYLGHEAPSRLFVSAADHRWKWANDPRGYDQGLYTPHLGIGGFSARHPYGSNFKSSYPFFDHSPLGAKASPAGSTGQVLLVSGTIIRPHLTSSVSYPAQKVHILDPISRHFGKDQYHMMAQARTLSVQADGHARSTPMPEFNRGVNPNLPNNAASPLNYSPSIIEPPPIPLQPPPYPGPQWTRMGLQGRDFGGPEIYPQP